MISDIVVQGFGVWSIVTRLPTIGFGPERDSIPVIPGAEYRVDADRLHYKLPADRMHYRNVANVAMRLYYKAHEE